VNEIKVKTCTMTRIGRHEKDFRALVADVVCGVLGAGPATDVGAVFVASFAARELCGIDDVNAAARDAIRVAAPSLAAPVIGPYRTGGEALLRGIEHCQRTGRDVLVVGCEKMTHLDAATAAGLLAARVSDDVEQQHGATLPALAALATTAYARAAHVPLHAFDDVSVKNHDHASRNPLAHFQQAITADVVRSSPLVADPLRRYHCAPMSDGAAACVLSRHSGDVRLSGWGRGVDAPRFHERVRLGAFPAATVAADAAFAMSGRTPADVDVVEIHDAFSPFELMNLEAMRFFGPGESWRALARGSLAIGGLLAVNPSGGMKARGHPIGVCGLTSLAEIHQQLTGAAGERQQPNANIAVIQSAGGVSPETFVFVLETCA
jgi:acetyl-CoA C-acetyltransferase